MGDSKEKEVIPEEVLEKTKELMGPLINGKPKLEDKYLSRPPFRYLHEVIKNFIENTGCFAGLFTDDEMDKHKAGTWDKAQKTDFLTKIVNATQAALGVDLAVKPLKVVSGLEVRHTHEFLQTLARVKTEKADWKAAMEKAKGGGGGGEEKKKSDREHKHKEREHKSRSSKDDKDREREHKSKKDDGDEDKKEDRHRSHKSDRHREKDGDDEKKRHRSERDKDGDEKREHRSDREKDRERRSKDKDKDREDKEHSSSKDKDREDKEHSSSKDKEKQSSEKDKEKRKKEEEEKKKEEEEKKKEDDSAAPADADPNRAERPNTARKAPPQVRSNVVETAAQPVVQPKKEKGDTPQGVIVDKKKATGVIMEGKGGDSDSEEEQAVAPPFDENKLEETPGEDGADAAEGRGYISKMAAKTQEEHEKAKQEQELGNSQAVSQKAANSTSDGGGIVLKSRRGGKTQESFQSEVTKLRDWLQTLTRTTSPLGKAMDYIQEDLDSMQRELEMWRSETKQQSAAWTETQKQTDELLQPLYSNLHDLEDSISDQLQKIFTVKASILRQDQTIETLLSMVVTTGSYK